MGLNLHTPQTSTKLQSSQHPETCVGACVILPLNRRTHYPTDTHERQRKALSNMKWV